MEEILDGKQLVILRKTIIISSLWYYRYISISPFLETYESFHFRVHLKDA
jgi:hypothetical protein